MQRHEMLFLCSYHRYFEKQFELADAVKLPMFLHMRAAGEDFCEIVARNKGRWFNFQLALIIYPGNQLVQKFLVLS